MTAVHVYDLWGAGRAKIQISLLFEEKGQLSQELMRWKMGDYEITHLEMLVAYHSQDEDLTEAAASRREFQLDFDATTYPNFKDSFDL